MADSKISALTAVTTPVGTDEFAVNDGGVSKKMSLSQVNGFVDPSSASSSAAQTLGTADTYVTGSATSFNAGRLKVGSFYRCYIDLTKTAAGVATPVVTLRLGTAGTTADAAACAMTFPAAQTAAVDNGLLIVQANIRAVGASTGQIEAVINLMRSTTTAAGFFATASPIMAPVRTLSAATLNTNAATVIGVSINAGASSAWTTQLVQADIKNLT